MGYFIVLDGLDGSGKGTQAALLCDRLATAGKAVKLISFPNYGTPGAAAVEYYLGGALGADPAATNAYAASTFYAVDRYLSWRSEWGLFLDGGEDNIVVANRYTSANAVHQLSKLPRGEWDGFLAWLGEFEFARLGLPRPDLTVYLEMTPAISMRLVSHRSDTTGQKKDIHELDPHHLEASYAAALYASDAWGWTRLPCYAGDEPKSIEAIADAVWAEVCAKIPGIDSAK